MCIEINLINLPLLIKNQDLDHLRRLLKSGEKVYLLSDEEKKQFEQINFKPEDPKTISSEFRVASEVSGIPILKIIGVGIDDNIMFIKLKEKND